MNSSLVLTTTTPPTVKKSSSKLLSSSCPFTEIGQKILKNNEKKTLQIQRLKKEKMISKLMELSRSSKFLSAEKIFEKCILNLHARDVLPYVLWSNSKNLAKVEKIKDDFTNRFRNRSYWINKLKHLEEDKVRQSLKREEWQVQQVWNNIVKKKIVKAQKLLSFSFVTKVSNLKKIAFACSKGYKKFLSCTSRCAKDATLKSKKILKELLSFWRRNEKEEKELRKKAERAALDRLRLEEEEKESRRQARKLNFLITQTELYGHFIAGKNKLPEVSVHEATVDKNIDFADVHENVLHQEAERMAMIAYSKQKAHVRDYDHSPKKGKHLSTLDQNSSTITIVKPNMLNCDLKNYQLKGMQWLVNLYEQGINGILADEMGLGKTVQAISLLSYLAENYNIRGPFLVVAPSSTLHNWEQELKKFVPSFKVLPYWGNVSDRKNLRKNWRHAHIKGDTNFNVLVTSYQLIVVDEAYLSKIMWKYMILDEAQAVKSSNSIRWKTLLTFKCRNRLLLTGTPIQNSMQELWALLHFIMPGLFDSHDEFSEWFSKDIESHVESKSTLDAHQLNRLHVILKPFMLRRIKKDVETELTDKIEINIACEMSSKQIRLYHGLSRENNLVSLSDRIIDDDFSYNNLMNMVMQLRKICNHPELFEKNEIKSPFILEFEKDYPKSIFGLCDHDNFSNLKFQLYSHYSMMRNNSFLDVAHSIDSKRNIDIPFSNDFIDQFKREITIDKSNRIPECISDIFIPNTLRLGSIKFPPLINRNEIILNGHTKLNNFGSCIHLPNMPKMINDSGKLLELDKLLIKLYSEHHRVLIYNQMTKMIDILEEYMQFKQYRYLRLDGSSRLIDRRDMVHEWQTNENIFAFLLSTRAGGLGINLTAADTVIFYDSDWNPTVDQQAMDRAHRLGQTKQVTVYKLITKGTVEERIIEKARQKDEMHQVVIAAGGFNQKS